MVHELTQYNLVMQGNNEPIEFNQKLYNGFYISYNNYDIAIYGCVTTALVLGQMQKFFILKGNHQKQYAELIEQGFDRCLDYYKNNIADSHHRSDKI